MALIECPECKKEISSKALSCPTCGCPIEIKDHTNNDTTLLEQMEISLEAGNRAQAAELYFSSNKCEWKEAFAYTDKLIKKLKDQNPEKYNKLSNNQGCNQITAIILFLIVVITIVIFSNKPDAEKLENIVQSNIEKKNHKLTTNTIDDFKKFEKKLFKIEEKATRDINQFSTAAQNVGTEYSIYDLYNIADQAEKSCRIVYGLYGKINNEIPQSLSDSHKKLLKKSVNNLQTAYLTKIDAFKYSKKFLDEQKPSYMNKYENHMAISQSSIFLAVSQLTQIKTELGLLDTND
jgi:hypothetical protein